MLRPKHFTPGPFALGRAAPWINSLSLAWIIIANVSLICTPSLLDLLEQSPVHRMPHLWKIQCTRCQMNGCFALKGVFWI
jgi:hypothetical protein